jgi:hypothetical protein
MPPKKAPQFKPDIISFLARRDFVADMEPAARREFLSQVAQIVNLPAFLRVIDDMQNSIACAGIMASVDNGKVSAAINIIEEIKKKFLSLATLFESETRGKEDFDANEAI